MINDFKFFRGKENEEEIISQNEWNRRRDALAERYIVTPQNDFQVEEERIQPHDLVYDDVMKFLGGKKIKVPFWKKLIPRMYNSFFTLCTIVFFGMFVGFWLSRLVSYLSQLK